MTTTIGVFDSHEKALKALKMLEHEGIPLKKISLLGKAEIVDDEVKIQHHDPLVKAPVGIGVAAGLTVGLLTGVGIFVVPGLGFLYGAGALVGALAGMDFGLITGGLVSVFATLGVKHEDALMYHEHLKEGKFLLTVNGTEEEVAEAKEILQTENAHIET
jgi:uncharacterized membrane protein